MVYVDNFYVTGVRYRGMKMCHMIADTRAELLAAVDSIGVNRKWIQDKDTPREHFDICFSKRELAIKNGAQEIGFRELAEMTRVRTYEGKTQIY
jgi:hypothetical protein